MRTSTARSRPTEEDEADGEDTTIILDESFDSVCV